LGKVVYRGGRWPGPVAGGGGRWPEAGGRWPLAGGRWPVGGRGLRRQYACKVQFTSLGW